jgi:hypothetical protein
MCGGLYRVSVKFTKSRQNTKFATAFADRTSVDRIAADRWSQAWMKAI